MSIKKERCHDCDCLEGEIHKLGCDMETCPFCGGQLLSCECCYIQLGYEVDEDKPFNGLPEEVYMHGLSDEEDWKWQEILVKKGRIPFVVVPVLCRLCGKQYPDFFMLSDKDWQKYIIPELQNEVLCRDCFIRMKELFPNGWHKH